MTDNRRDVAKMTSCPKCGLEAKSLLHPFCTHKECPVREALRKPETAAAQARHQCVHYPAHSCDCEAGKNLCLKPEDAAIYHGDIDGDGE